MADKNPIPVWIIKLIVSAIITILIGAAFTWAQGTSAKVAKHEKELAVQEQMIITTKDNITEIKQSQRRIEDKLDDVIRR